MKPFTYRELRAMEEALSLRPDAEIDADHTIEPLLPSRQDYDSAWAKIAERLSKMEGT